MKFAPYLFFFLLNWAHCESKSTLKWAHTESDIPINDSLITGELENGFRYLIYPNAEPPGRVSIRLHVDAGSLMEEDDQRGMAHFLEHMVFEGSENYSSEELIPEMQRLGIAFGAHANAYTSFDETVYMLDLPNLEDKTLNLAFTVMRDFADGALLLESEVEAERGVILSEKNSRDSVDFRLMRQQFGYLFPKHLASKRMPIGTEQCIKNTSRDRIKDFYDDYYVPERMTFIVVGDIDPESYKKKIESAFSTLKSNEESSTPPALGVIDPVTSLQVAVFSDKEVDEESVSLTRCIQHKSHPDTKSTRHKKLTLNIANAIISKRLAQKAKEEESPINGGAAYKNTWFDEITFGSVYVTPSEGMWKDAVSVLETEFRRALEYGFTQSEFEEVTANLSAAAKVRVDTSSTRMSAGIAGEIIPTINDRKTISTPETDYKLVLDSINRLSPKDVHKAYRDFWNDGGMSLILTTNVEEQSTKSDLKTLFNNSKKTPVQPPQEAEKSNFAYTDFGEKGEITNESHVQKLDFYQLTLSNGVKAHVKKTDFEKDTISITLSFGNGLQGYPVDHVGLTSFAESIFILGGIGKHDQEELQRITAGKRVSTSFHIAEDHFALRGLTNQEDLEFQLQLLVAYLTDPAYRDEAVRQYKKSLPDVYDQIRHTLNGPLTKMSAWSRGNDHRFMLADEKDALGLDKLLVQDWLRPQLTQSALEINIVGDLDLTKTKQSLSKTIGALNRESKPSPLTLPAIELTLPELDQKIEFDYSSELDRAASIVSWRTKGLTTNISESRQLNILASIFTNRIRTEIREKLGSSYSPYARSEMSSGFSNFGQINAVSIAKPEDLEMISNLLIKLGSELGNGEITQDELDRALNPALESLNQSSRKNSYWLEVVLNRSSVKPHLLAWAKSRTADYKSISLREINYLAKKYLPPENSHIFHLKPKN